MRVYSLVLRGLASGRDLLPPALRVSLLRLLLGAVVLGLGLKEAAARSEEALMDLGRHLAVIAEAGVGAGQRSLVINGQSLGLRVVSVEASVPEVLDYYERWCRSGSEDLPSIPDGDFQATSERHDDSWRDMTLRSQQGDEGFIACVHTGPVVLSDELLARRIGAVAETGELSHLGRFHYTFVARTGRGVRAISVWTGRGFDPMDLFKSAGDAPGLDMPGVPRPPGSRRILSAGEAGESAYLAQFELEGSHVAAIAGFYRGHFARNQVHILADSSSGSSEHSLVVVRGAFLYAVHVTAAGGRSTTTTIARAE